LKTNLRVAVIVARITSEGIQVHPLDVVPVAGDLHARLEIVSPHPPSHGENRAGWHVTGGDGGDVGCVVFVELGGEMSSDRGVRGLILNHSNHSNHGNRAGLLGPRGCAGKRGIKDTCKHCRC
jgi:hypothetical protein